MPEAAPLVWTVIATYQAEPWLERCLDSCRRSSVPTRVVIIDNASSDRSVEIAREFEATCFPQERNLGFGVANNLGLHHAREHGAEWVLLLNQDAFLGEDTLARMLDVASRHPEVGVFSPFHRDAGGAELDGPFATALGQTNPELFHDLESGSLRDVYEVPFVNAAIWLMRREALEKVGGFDPLFFLYGEDDDWCLRAARLGVKLGVVPSAEAIHARGGESGSRDKMQQVTARANRIYLRHVLAVKRPDSPMWRSWLGAAWETVSLGSRLVLRGRFDEGSARFRGFFRALGRAGKISRHRRTSARPGPHWIF